MRSVILAAVLLLATAPSARAQGCFASFASGGYTFCVSAYGQVTKIERPNGANHVQSDGVREGFNVCRGDDYLNARAYGADDQEGFSEGPVVVQPNGPNTLPLTITLHMFGDLEVRQRFAWDKTDRQLRITMRVKNTGAAAVPFVRLQRMLDFTLSKNHLDYGGTTSEAAFAWGGGTGVSLAAESLAVTHSTALVSPAAVDRYECGSFGDFGEAVSGEDLIGRVYYSFGTLRAGQYGTAAFLYRIF